MKNIIVGGCSFTDKHFPTTAMPVRQMPEPLDFKMWPEVIGEKMRWDLDGAAELITDTTARHTSFGQEIHRNNHFQSVLDALSVNDPDFTLIQQTLEPTMKLRLAVSEVASSPETKLLSVHDVAPNLRPFIEPVEPLPNLDQRLARSAFVNANGDPIVFFHGAAVDFNRNFNHEKMIVFGNLPYNISTQILIKWIRYNNLNNIFKKFILMFQKEVAERIIAETHEKNYGRLAVLSSWKLNIKKVTDVLPNSFYPIPKVKSTVLLIEPKNEYFNLKNMKNLEHITNIFFNQRRKMIKKPLNIIFKNVNEISKKLNININDRPQNLSSLKYFEICKEYESLNL